MCKSYRCTDIYMSAVGNKRHFGSKLYFLSYSTGESGMIVELFSRRLFIKILFCRPTILIFRFRITEYFIKNFRKFQKIPTPPPTPLTHPPYHSPPPNTPNYEPTQNFKFTFLKNTI